MTTEERKRVDPVEVVARALCNRNKPEQILGEAWDNLLSWVALEQMNGGTDSTKERDRFAADATSALEALSKSGFLNENYYEWKRGQGK